MISVRCPRTDGPAEEITVHDRTSLDSVVKANEGTYKGMTVGRYGNRIAKGVCELEGEKLELATNNGPNHLHGGVDGFDKRRWVGEIIEYDGIEQVLFSLNSPDGDQGYPGDLDVTCRVWLNDLNHLGWTYEARSSKPTYVNLTNHTYWNLSGDGAEATVAGHALQTACQAYCDQDDTCIPTGLFVGMHDDPVLAPFLAESRVLSSKGADADAGAGAGPGPGAGAGADAGAGPDAGPDAGAGGGEGPDADASAGGSVPAGDKHELVPEAGSMAVPETVAMSPSSTPSTRNPGAGTDTGIDGSMLTARLLTAIGDKSGGKDGFNHCFVRSAKPEVAASHVGGHPAHIATLAHPVSGRRMHVDTTEPGV